MKKIGVAIVGLGTVGGGTYEILTKNNEYFKQTQNLDITVENVMELRQERLDLFGISSQVATTNLMEVISNPGVDIIVEVVGGVTFAKEVVERALMAGKHVVTANKELLAKHLYDLEKLAKSNNVGLYYEASCVGGVPIIRSLIDGLQGNKVQEMKGIINGTTNYILSKMTDEGGSYSDILKEAQALGYAESDPTADVEGFDASYKLSILASLAFQTKVPLGAIYREGISKITKEDIAYGKELGYTVKLLGIAKRTSHGIEGRVHPTFIRNDDQLAGVKGSFNGVTIKGDSVGDIMLYGRGAGDLPTGSAIVSDIIYCSQRIRSIGVKHFYTPFGDQGEKATAKNLAKDFEAQYYVRLKVDDKVGVLAKVGSLFEKSDVSIKEVIQKGNYGDGTVPLVVTTHVTRESKIQKALQKIDTMTGILEVAQIIRIEE